MRETLESRLDRVIKINASEDAIVFDAQFKNGKLLNRVVGLSGPTSSIHGGDQVEFIPDRCSMGERNLMARPLKRRMRDSFRRDLELASGSGSKWRIGRVGQIFCQSLTCVP